MNLNTTIPLVTNDSLYFIRPTLGIIIGQPTKAELGLIVRADDAGNKSGGTRSGNMPEMSGVKLISLIN